MLNDSINRFLGVLCYPFTSMETFWKDQIDRFIQIAAKRPEETKTIQDIQEQLRGELLAYIGQNYNIYSYDEIYLYLDKCYLYDAGKYDRAYPMYLDIMKRMANALISHRDGRIVFKYWENKEDRQLFGGFAGNNKVTLFHRLNCHIPMDVIAIVYMAVNQQETDSQCLNYFYGTIEVADQQLSRLLEKGVAENHLHKGVSRSFSSVWDSMMEPLTAQKAGDFLGKRLVSGTKAQNKQMLFYILACGIVRGWLVCRMKGSIRNGEETKVQGKDTTPRGHAAVTLKEVERLVKHFCNGAQLEDDYKANFQNASEKDMLVYYTGLWNALEEYVPQEACLGRFCAIVLEEKRNLHTFDENVFLYHALERMYHGRMPEEDGLCVMQYLRIRNHFFHITVQQKTIKGLDYFQQMHYSVNSRLNRIHVSNYWENAIREQLQNQNLHKIEFRISMQRSYKEFKKDVLNFLIAYQKILEEDYCYFDGEHYIPGKKFPQAGLVLHLLKRKDEKYPEKCLQNAPTDCGSYQFGRLQEMYKEQIEMFVKLRSEHTELSRYLVGIDAASLENSTPVWVFAPIYNQARDSAVEWIGRDREGGYVQSLGFTFHAGEDFRHILSGLRRIDEAVEHLKFHAGDRIGHGIALGINPKIWKEQNPVIIIPQMEALENYLWAYDTLRRNYSDFQSSILAYMEQRIFELAESIYGKSADMTLEMLITGYYQMFSEAMTGEHLKKSQIQERLCKIRSGGLQWDADLLAASRHCNVYVRKMEQPIHYEISEQDLCIIRTLQNILKGKLGKKGIVVEVNPSSNTAIADMDDLKENQFYQLNQVNDAQNVMICINSDDPAVFNTNVSNELAYIYYGMLDQNVNREAALLWIDRIRKNGMECSFIHHQESDEMLLKKLAELIKRM